MADRSKEGVDRDASASSAIPQIWPKDDVFRLVGLLQAKTLAPLLVASAALKSRFEAPVKALAKSEKDPNCGALEELSLQLASAALASTIAEAESAVQVPKGLSAQAQQQATLQELRSLEILLKTEMRYIYYPDWEAKPGSLVSRKGTWLKTSTVFSSELSEKDGEKLHVPRGVAMPVLQIGRVVDPEELKRHNWVVQHCRVWLKPALVQTLERRRGRWFVYAPHFQDKGSVIVAEVDTWLKRTCEMSGELLPSELIYVPRGVPIQLAHPWAPVEEEWEKNRHKHIHLHRQVDLAAPPVTIKQEQYDILVGGGIKPPLHK